MLALPKIRIRILVALIAVLVALIAVSGCTTPRSHLSSPISGLRIFFDKSFWRADWIQFDEDGVAHFNGTRPQFGDNAIWGTENGYVILYDDYGRPDYKLSISEILNLEKPSKVRIWEAHYSDLRPNKWIRWEEEEKIGVVRVENANTAANWELFRSPDTEYPYFLDGPLPPGHENLNAKSLSTDREQIGRGMTINTRIFPLTTNDKRMNVILPAIKLGDADLELILKFKNLEKLDLSNCKVSNLKNISRLKSLKELKLINCDLRDLKGLEKLPNLRLLDVSDNTYIRLKDLNSLKKSLPDCEVIYAHTWAVVEESIISRETFQVPERYLRTTTIAPILDPEYSQILEEMNGFIFRGSSLSRISDISPISKAINLTYAELQDNSITDLTPLANCKKLEVLWLDGNLISNIRPLSGLIGLEELHLYDNRIEDLSPLKKLTKLKALHLTSNQIRDLTPLYSLKNLHTITLEDNPLITKKQIEKLQSAFPHCTISHDYK